MIVTIIFTDVYNPRAHIEKMEESKTTLAQKSASLGANCTIVCSITIGRYAFIGAGAVVTHTVPDYALVYGNPAKQAGWVCQCGEKLDEALGCPTCTSVYRHSAKGLEEVL